MIPIADEATLNAVRDAGCEQLLPSRHRIAVGMGTCGTGNGSESVYHAFADAIGKRGLDVQLVPTGCFGYCAEEPLVNVWSPGQPIIILKRVRPDQVNQILDGLARKSFPEALVLCKVEHWDHITAELNYGTGQPDVPAWTEIPFFTGQKKLVLRNCGLINPGDIRIFWHWRLSYSVRCAPGRVARRSHRTPETSQIARTRRSRVFHGSEIRVPPQGNRTSEIPHLQCG